MNRTDNQSHTKSFIRFNANHRMKQLRLCAGLAVICLIALSIVRGSPLVAGADGDDAQNVVAGSSALGLNPTPGWFAIDIDFTSSVAWGDMDGDGDLDLAVGNDLRGPNKVYLNKGRVLQTTPAWTSTDDHLTNSIAWGDMDGDGDLDLATGSGNPSGNDPQSNRVYLNENGMLQPTATWTSADAGHTESIAWGDVDGDGDLDLAAGNYGQPNKVYLNEGSRLQTTAAWISTDSDETYSIAWGDMDSDGDLDLATGNYFGLNKVYLNESGRLQTAAAWASANIDLTTSIAWGDVDGDGDLDLAAGNYGQPNTIYLNEGSRLQTIPVWVSADDDYTWSIAWGDIDSDGDLDLVAGNGVFQPNKIYLNENGTLRTTAGWISADSGDTSSIALGDVEGDGDLDLAVGNSHQPIKVYLNEGNLLQATAAWLSADSDKTTSVAWGDIDGDSDLDLAAGNSGQPNQVYLNENGRVQTTPAWIAADSDDTQSIAWGDVDGDGDLDLVAGNYGQPNAVYLNEGRILRKTPDWISAESDMTTSVAWGDMEGDGDLDLAVGNIGKPSKIYLNEDGRLQATPVWSTFDDVRNFTSSVAWGDIDRDGDLDLAIGNTGIEVYLNRGKMLERTPIWRSDGYYAIVAWGDIDGDGDVDLAAGNRGQPNKVYLNDDGKLQTIAAWTSADNDYTLSIALGDADGDGDLDLAAGTSGFGRPNKIYINNSGLLRTTAVWTSATNYSTTSVAWGDVDSDGDLDLAAGNSNQPNVVFLNLKSAHPAYTRPNDRPLSIVLNLNSDPVFTFNGQSSTALAPANFYAVPSIRQSGVIPITYTLFHPASEPVRAIRVYYSLDGGFSAQREQWREAKPVPGTQMTDLTTDHYPTRTSANTHVFNWDVFSSGFFGQSDNVVVRIEALPNLKPVKNSVPGPFQRPFVAAQTYPFRVRGIQIRVISENYQPMPNTLVYRMPMTQTLGGLPIGKNGLPFRTSSTGYLASRGELYPNDRLLALAPIQSTQKYTLYLTSATPTEAGLNAHTVTQAGVQTLTVSAANPLLLLNLDLSLEWDVGNDSVFLAQLRENLLKTSYALYDWSNGQVALGQLNIYQAKERWDTADIRIYASNQIRPVSHRGGIVSDTVILPLPNSTQSITATRGEIRIGPTWNRYGDQGAIGDDWPNVLAHELGHYALFLEDTYLGLDETTNLLIPIPTCTGTATTDPYDSVSSEFRHNDGRWQQDCGRTLAELPEWDLIRLAYPVLHAPPPENTGPVSMPFAFTQIEIKPASPGATPLLVDGNIALNGAGDELAGGRAYLIQPGAHLIDMGRPLLSSIQARGAHEGDELCLFAVKHFACSRLSNNAPAQFEPQLQPLWMPTILLTPINTTTLQIQVDIADSGLLTAIIYPNGNAPQSVTLTPGVPQTVILSQPAVEAWVDIQGSSSTQRMITGYTTGSGPGRARSHGGPGRARSHGGSFTSGDGRVTLYPPATLPNDVSMVLQTATVLPDLPPGRMPIGRAYQIRASAENVDFTGASVTFQYVGMEVLLSGQPEANLTVYFWDGAVWHGLYTVLDQVQNFASARLPSSGLYVLMSGVEIPLYGPGWNLVSYPVQETRPVTQALASIERYYFTVYGYEPTDVNDPWKVHDVSVPGWVNDLHELKPNQGYWISATQNITWFIDQVPVRPSSAPATLPMPPATFYGDIPADSSVLAAADLTVTAKVNGKVCGQGQTRTIEGLVVYVVDVLASGPGSATGCGTAGQLVTLEIDSQTFAMIPWNNDRPKGLFFTLSQRAYLPFVTK